MYGILNCEEFYQEKARGSPVQIELLLFGVQVVKEGFLKLAKFELGLIGGYNPGVYNGKETKVLAG